MSSSWMDGFGRGKNTREPSNWGSKRGSRSRRTGEHLKIDLQGRRRRRRRTTMSITGGRWGQSQNAWLATHGRGLWA